MELGSDYAAARDVLNSDKDYEAEMDILEQHSGRQGSGLVHEVCDLGRGTGSHASSFARRGQSDTTPTGT